MDIPLTPLRFLERAVEIHPNDVAVIDGDRQWTWSEFAEQVTLLASALRANGVERGERVAFIATNSAEMLVGHFAVPLAGGVLVAVNTRLSVEEVVYICQHSNSTLMFGDTEFLQPITEQLEIMPVRELIELPNIDGTCSGLAGATTYTNFLARGGGPVHSWQVDDEYQLIAINYTSGTTGKPKGVEYTHRGAYLNSLGEVYHQRLQRESRYLWTLPMFHCNGWCTTWALTAVAGTHVCLRAVRGRDMWSLIDREKISHMAGAPTVLTTLAAAPEAHRVNQSLTITTAGAPPSPAIISRIQDLGAEVVHVYGLTETYGPYAVCEPQHNWNELSAEELAGRLARQGVGMLTSERLRVVRTDREPDGRLIDVAQDGVEIGEIVMRGNSVMKAYHRDPAATSSAFHGGWFHSGDLAVMHADGYAQIVDRAKDVIISGGENISSIEVEQALLSHPHVHEAAVVGIADQKWGETPLAFVVLSATAPSDLSEAELIQHVRQRIAHYKAPKEVVLVADLPKTSTGKTRKEDLRQLIK